MDDILGLGLLLYVSHAWLSEVFRTVVRRNLLEEGGFATHMRDDVSCPLVELLRGKLLPLPGNIYSIL